MGFRPSGIDLVGGPLGDPAYLVPGHNAFDLHSFNDLDKDRPLLAVNVQAAIAFLSDHTILVTCHGAGRWRPVPRVLRAYTNPLRTAQTAACVRSFTASFRRMFCTCSLTVSTLISNERPISLLLKPRAKCRRTCVSRGVSWT